MAAIRALTAKVYAALGSNGAYSIAQLRGHQHHFPDGQFVAVYEDAIVGYCATFRIGGRLALQPHDWVSITRRGSASRHDLEGDSLYSMENYVYSDYSGLRIGHRLTNACKHIGRESS